MLMSHELRQLRPEELAAAKRLVDVALEEDLAGQSDITTSLLIPPDAKGQVGIVARQSGILCGAALIELVLEAVDANVHCCDPIVDGTPLQPGTTIARLDGSARSLLTAERTILNFLTMLSGTATLTSHYVAATQGTHARILDTRKTLPGLRMLQKYAVRCGGGSNHRMGLFDAVLVKDNHLAWHTQQQHALSNAIRQIRATAPAGMTVEIEVDNLNQLREILPAGPDIVLLDNMPPAELSKAVELRNQLAPGVQLEASGGVNLSTVAAIAASGVDRISVGALTHSAPALDIGFDWLRD